jgi:hypothetical protein
MNAAEYHADPAPVPSLSSSIAKLLITRSPKHAWMQHPRLNQNYKPEVKEEFDLGTAAHALLLEGVNKMQIFNPSDYPNQKGGGVATGWTNKAIREARDAARLEGKIPVLAETASALNAMVATCHEAFSANPDLEGYTISGDGGVSEHTIVWHEGETYFRSRLDRVSTDRKVIFDYKSTDNAEPTAFTRTIINMGYDLQAAFYLRALQKPEARYILIAQETEAPFAVSFIGMPPAFIELGRRKVEHAIAIWKECMASGKWPAYPTRVCYVDPPEYEMAKWEVDWEVAS